MSICCAGNAPSAKCCVYANILTNNNLAILGYIYLFNTGTANINYCSNAEGILVLCILIHIRTKSINALYLTPTVCLYCYCSKFFSRLDHLRLDKAYCDRISLCVLLEMPSS